MNEREDKKLYGLDDELANNTKEPIKNKDILLARLPIIMLVALIAFAMMIGTGMPLFFQKNGYYEDVKIKNVGTYTGEFKHGEFHGNGKLTLTKGEVLEGHFIMGELTGAGTITYLNGNVYEGTIINGVPQGKGVLTAANGTKIKEN